MWLRIFKHLLPHGKVWHLTIGRPLRQFFSGLSGLSSEIKQYVDLVWFDIQPQQTRDLSLWEQHFGLEYTGLTDQQRRDRIAAAWKALGGQSPSYIQQTLRDNGFDVYIYEWQLVQNDLVYYSECGEETAACGEETAACGDFVGPLRILYPVNPYDVLTGQTATGDHGCVGADSACVGAGTAGIESTAFSTSFLLKNLPAEPTALIPPNQFEWPYIVYFGGETLGSLAQIPVSRKGEFEALCLRICPTHLLIGLIVEYV